MHILHILAYPRNCPTVLGGGCTRSSYIRGMSSPLCVDNDINLVNESCGHTLFRPSTNTLSNVHDVSELKQFINL